MKRLLILIGLGGVLAAQTSSALQVNIVRFTGYYTLPGGEFTVFGYPANNAAFQAIYQNYSSLATYASGIPKDGNGFETFCMNTSTPQLGNPETATMSVGQVTLGTAWLYSEFARGILGGYNYTPGAGRAASAYDLQNAIWALQGQHVYSAAAASVFLSGVVTKFGSLAAAEAGSGGSYGVDELWLTYNGTTSQPMLAYVPRVPDGGVTAMLLGLGMLGLAGLRRATSK